MIGVYSERSVSILVKLIEIKIYVPDVINFGRWKYKF